MARYRLRRKTYGVAEAAGNVIGGTAEGVGKVMDSNIGGAIGGLAGGAALGAPLGAALGLGGPIGWLAAAGLSAAATRGLGKGLKSAGQDMQS
jgi:hypothetical protein